MSKLSRIVLLIGGALGLIALVRWLQVRSEAATRIQSLPDDVVKLYAPNVQTIPIQLVQVAPELREPMRRVSLLPLPIDKSWGRFVIAKLFGLMPIPSIDGVTIEIVHDDTASLRLYTPAVRRSDAALLWIHGGGYVIGGAAQDDRLCAQVVRDLGIFVASVEYRLAPEQPFPAPLDDCLAGWHWLQREAPRLGVDPARVVIGGESAGGGLAASLVQRVCDSQSTGTAMPIAQWLFCPMLDDVTATRRQLDSVNHFVWTNSRNLFGWQSYLGVEPGTDVVPAYAVPARREDLHGLPDTWIGVGDIDLFYVEDTAYAERLREAGVNVTLDVVPMAPHGFEAWAFDTTLVRHFLGRAQDWLQKEISNT